MSNSNAHEWKFSSFPNHYSETAKCIVEANLNKPWHRSEKVDGENLSFYAKRSDAGIIVETRSRNAVIQVTEVTGDDSLKLSVISKSDNFTDISVIHDELICKTAKVFREYPDKSVVGIVIYGELIGPQKRNIHYTPNLEYHVFHMRVIRATFVWPDELKTLTDAGFSVIPSSPCNSDEILNTDISEMKSSFVNEEEVKKFLAKNKREEPLEYFTNQIAEGVMYSTIGDNGELIAIKKKTEGFKETYRAKKKENTFTFKVNPSKSDKFLDFHTYLTDSRIDGKYSSEVSNNARKLCTVVMNDAIKDYCEDHPDTKKKLLTKYAFKTYLAELQGMVDEYLSKPTPLEAS